MFNADTNGMGGKLAGIIDKDIDPALFAQIARKTLILIQGHAHTLPSELASKLGMSGDIRVTEQIVGLVQAIHEGRPCIIDEIDTIPPQTLMSVKALFTIHAGEGMLPA